MTRLEFCRAQAAALKAWKAGGNSLADDPLVEAMLWVVGGQPESLGRPKAREDRPAAQPILPGFPPQLPYGEITWTPLPNNRPADARS